MAFPILNFDVPNNGQYKRSHYKKPINSSGVDSLFLRKKTTWREIDRTEAEQWWLVSSWTYVSMKSDKGFWYLSEAAFHLDKHQMGISRGLLWRLREDAAVDVSGYGPSSIATSTLFFAHLIIGRQVNTSYRKICIHWIPFQTSDLAASRSFRSLFCLLHAFW